MIWLPLSSRQQLAGDPAFVLLLTPGVEIVDDLVAAAAPEQAGVGQPLLELAIHQHIQ
ncbi:hypothetical protein D3C79_1047760 [compost metagenome]